MTGDMKRNGVLYYALPAIRAPHGRPITRRADCMKFAQAEGIEVLKAFEDVRNNSERTKQTLAIRALVSHFKESPWDYEPGIMSLSGKG